MRASPETILSGLFLMALIMAVAHCAPESPAHPAAMDTTPPPFALENIYKGVAWVGGRNPVSDDALINAKEHGIEWIAQTPFGWMENRQSASVGLNPNPRLWGESDEGLRMTTRMAHEHRMKVMLKPHIWLRRPLNEGWIGEIDFQTEKEWKQWEQDYRTFILYYTRLAAEEKIDILCIATELSNPVRERPLFWKNLIAEIRSVYDGELTYAANWYRDYDETAIWSDLDYIGINAYFPLTDKENPSVEEIMRGWKPLTERFEQLAKTYDKPILFTEVGYKNTRGTTIRPWEWPRRMDQSVIDETEQVNAYEALFMTFGNRPWVRGFFMWKWFPDATRITPERVEFSPQNKAAAEALKKWYGFTG